MPVVFQKADNSNKIVILDKEVYNNRMRELLSTKEYTKIKEDRTKKYTIAVSNSINNIQMIMTKQDKVAVKPNNPIIPKVYGLTKIHKTGNKMRPIVSNIGAPTHKLAKWLVKRFESFPKLQTLSTKNSLDLIKNLRKSK